MVNPEFIERRPRHEALDPNQCRITVQWSGAQGSWEAELADVSRQGLKLILAIPLTDNARVRLSLQQPVSGFHVTLPVTVLWVRRLDGGRWTAGCLFDRELPWELLGELFLNGILSAETMSDGKRPEMV